MSSRLAPATRRAYVSWRRRGRRLPTRARRRRPSLALAIIRLCRPTSTLHECGERTEVVQSFSDRPWPPAPSAWAPCARSSRRSGSCQGSGFYRTDSQASRQRQQDDGKVTAPTRQEGRDKQLGSKSSSSDGGSSGSTTAAGRRLTLRAGRSPQQVAPGSAPIPCPRRPLAAASRGVAPLVERCERHGPSPGRARGLRRLRVLRVP